MTHQTGCRHGARTDQRLKQLVRIVSDHPRTPRNMYQSLAAQGQSTPSTGPLYRPNSDVTVVLGRGSSAPLSFLHRLDSPPLARSAATPRISRASCWIQPRILSRTKKLAPRPATSPAKLGVSVPRPCWCRSTQGTDSLGRGYVGVPARTGVGAWFGSWALSSPRGLTAILSTRGGEERRYRVIFPRLLRCANPAAGLPGQCVGLAHRPAAGMIALQ